MKYDVVIVGGGTSGCSAAYNSAKLGLKTLLVEKNNFLGGLMTGGLVVPIMKSSVTDLNTDYYKKLIETAKKYNSQITYKDKNDGWLNPELMKIVLDDLLTSDKVKGNLDILFETTIKDVKIVDKTLKSIVLKNDILSIPIEATYFIDTTGYGELCELCNCEFMDDTAQVQQNSLRFIVGNVNIKKFTKFILEQDLNRDITNTYRSEINTNNEIHFTSASTWDTNKKWAIDKYLKKGVKNGLLEEHDRSYFQVFSVAGSTNQVAFNCPRINNYKNKPFKASKELISARKAIYRLFNFCKQTFPGFEKAEIINIATQTGVRENRRLKTKYTFTKEDIINHKTFKNNILEANYSIDIHSDKKNKSVLKTIPVYQLPVESLISKDIKNLFVAGKLVGADFEAHSALRVQKSCMSMAEGLAKYLAKN